MNKDKIMDIKTEGRNIKVGVINSSTNPLPGYSTEQSAGMDVRASLDSPMIIAPGKRVLVPTGLKVAVPDGFELQLRPRSGLALKNGISLVNTPGTIDADYRGEINVIMINLSDEPFTVNNGDRICQAVLAPCFKVCWMDMDSLDETDRGEGGFGHTGVK